MATGQAQTGFIGVCLAMQQLMERNQRILIYGTQSHINLKHMAVVQNSKPVYEHKIGFKLLDLQRATRQSSSSSSSSTKWTPPATEWTSRPPFAGQGARSYFVTAPLVQILLNNRVSHFWDLHMKDLAAKKNSMVLMAFPQLFHHEVDSARADRGSDRLLQTMDPSIADTDNIVVQFTAGFGIYNRTQTLVFAIWYAHMIGAGIHCEWRRNASVDISFEDCWDFDIETMLESTNCKYLKVHETESDQSIKDASFLPRSATCIWSFGFQCEPEHAIGNRLEWFRDGC